MAQNTISWGWWRQVNTPIVVLRGRRAWASSKWLRQGFSSKGFPYTRLAQHWEIMFRAVRGRVIPARRRVPAPLAGRRAGTGTTRAGAPPRGEPKPAPGRPVSAIAHGVSRPELAHSWCAQLADVTPASVRKRRR